jgi:soluble lytic murein transglycosylase-like protein
MELAFARSRRRAAERRRLPRRRNPLAWRSVRAVALAAVALALVAESTESSSAKVPPHRVAAKAAVGRSVCPVAVPFRAAFARAAATTGLPLPLLVATAYEESRMDPLARSGAGATGLLQVMPATARSLSAGATGTAANVLAGARYLKQMLDRFGSVELALSAYNAGPTAVGRAGGAPTLETLRYVKNVEARAARLAGC